MKKEEKEELGILMFCNTVVDNFIEDCFIVEADKEARGEEFLKPNQVYDIARRFIVGSELLSDKIFNN